MQSYISATMLYHSIASGNQLLLAFVDSTTYQENITRRMYWASIGLIIVFGNSFAPWCFGLGIPRRFHQKHEASMSLGSDRKYTGLPYFVDVRHFASYVGAHCARDVRMTFSMNVCSYVRTSVYICVCSCLQVWLTIDMRPTYVFMWRRCGCKIIQVTTY